jgi:hypothetical protein
MNTETLPLNSTPYQQQNGFANTSQSGAACLSMVYRSFGKTVSQDEIWPAIAKNGRSGACYTRAYLIAQDALSRGFRAVAVQTGDPIQALRNCCASGIRVIVNHLLELGKPEWHYSVLANVDDVHVYLHDPLWGPTQYSHADFLNLWGPQQRECEIPGFVFIAMNASAAEPWQETKCPECHSRAFVPPPALFASLSICPVCDHLWRSDEGHEAIATKFKLNKVFEQLEKFSSVVLTLPGAAENTELKTQLDNLVRQKDKILAAAQEFSNAQKVSAQHMAAMKKSAEQAKEAHQRKLAERNSPMAPIEGHALGLSFLKSVGLMTG